MPIKVHNPKTVSLAGAYSLGAEVPAGARLLYVSGQVGINAKGKVQDGIEKQTAQVWKNIGQVLKSGGMAYKDIVKVNVYLTDSRFVGPYRAVRDLFMGAAPYPASTLVIVAGLVSPDLLVEVEAVAAK